MNLLQWIGNVEATGTSEGAEKGWESRGRKSRFRPPSGDSDKHHGAVCANCGRTVTHGEYSSGESKCCKKDVVPEEEYGKEDDSHALDSLRPKGPKWRSTSHW